MLLTEIRVRVLQGIEGVRKRNRKWRGVCPDLQPCDLLERASGFSSPQCPIFPDKESKSWGILTLSWYFLCRTAGARGESQNLFMHETWLSYFFNWLHKKDSNFISSEFVKVRRESKCLSVAPRLKKEGLATRDKFAHLSPSITKSSDWWILKSCRVNTVSESLGEARGMGDGLDRYVSLCCNMICLISPPNSTSWH